MFIAWVRGSNIISYLLDHCIFSCLQLSTINHLCMHAAGQAVSRYRVWQNESRGQTSTRTLLYECRGYQVRWECNQTTVRLLGCQGKGRSWGGGTCTGHHQRVVLRWCLLTTILDMFRSPMSGLTIYVPLLQRCAWEKTGEYKISDRCLLGFW